MKKEIERYLMENSISIKGIREMSEMSEEERIKKYGKNYPLLVTDYIGHKRKEKALWEKRIREIDDLIEETKKFAKDIGIEVW